MNVIQYETMASKLDAKPVASARPILPADGVELVKATDLTPEPVRWLWRDWLALGKLHILAGSPGQGKTTLALAMAAAVTVGGRWPDGTRCMPGNVLIWSGEDDPADTLLPRLIAMGADRARVYFICSARVAGESLPFDPARDLTLLQTEAERLANVRLLIADPVVSAISGDSHKNTEVRRGLQPLVDLAAALDCAVLGISHFSKGGQGQDPTQRVTGSVAFAAVARVVMVAAKVSGEDGEPTRVLARSKSNIGPDDGGFEYNLEQIEPLPGIQASRVTWGKSVKGTARELLTDPEVSSDGGTAREEAESFLRDLLTVPTPTKTVQQEAKAAGLSWATVRRASDSLGVIKKKGGMDGGWYWSLPAERAQEMLMMLTKNNEHLRETLSTFGEASEQEGVEL